MPPVTIFRPRRQLAPRPTPRQAVLNPSPGLPIKMASMQGMGDNLHQRALVRQLMQQNVVYLDTPWPSAYHDLVGPRLHLVPPVATTLRTQAKNVAREAAKYDTPKAPRQVRMVRTWYTGEDVRREGSILAAMVKNAGCTMPADFRLPVPQEWLDTIDAYIGMWAPTKPIMVLRPLVERTEWAGCAGRNPDFTAYLQLYLWLRSHYFVISVADLVPGKEWLVQDSMQADVELHQGELSFELLVALTKRAALVYCSAGFAPILAQAVGTPVVCVFGGHESSMTIKDGVGFAPTLGIDPIVPCSCFDHKHTHQKAIDLSKAFQDLYDFTGRIANAQVADRRLASAVARHQLAGPLTPVHESGGVGGSDCVSVQRAAENDAGVRSECGEDGTSDAGVLSDPAKL